jgi:hypothetical protein
MSTPDAGVAIVIPVRNDAARLRRCLAAIRDSAGATSVHVIVTDNGSTDDSASTAASAGATVLSLPRYRVGELRNIGAKTATAPLIAFIDADHLIDPGWIAAAVEVFQDPAVTAAGAPYSVSPTANWVQRAYNRFRPIVQYPQATDWLGSGNLVVRRDAFAGVGGFDTALESCEDVDLCNRLRLAGYHLLAEPRLRSVHLGDPASLRALFFGELWRGRDNIKVTLRGPLTLRALPSLAIPIVDLVCLVLIAGAYWTGFGVALASAVTFAGLAAMRALKMSAGRAVTAGDVAANFVVAAVYDVARALSLVARATHRTRRETAGERVVA